MLLAAACQGGGPSLPAASAPPPTTDAVPAPDAAPPDAAIPDAAPPPDGPPTPAITGAALTMRRTVGPRAQECTTHALTFRLVDAHGAVLGENVQTSECTGVCTAADKREARRRLRELEALIDSGKASMSELDYDYTGCREIGPAPGRIEHGVAGRDVAIFPDRYLGAHDVDEHGLRLALEICGAVYVTEPFAVLGLRSWPLENVTVRATPSGDAILVMGKAWSAGGTSGELFRLVLPTCPGVPLEQPTERYP